MPRLPHPPSKRRSKAREEKLLKLCEMLQSDPRLARIEVANRALAEREHCIAVQDVLDDFVVKAFKPRSLRKVTWGQHVESSKAMPCVEIGGHRYYPDHIIWRKDLTVAIEVKRYTGSSGTLQQVIGQSVVYSQQYGFVIVYIADLTDEGTLARLLDPDPQRLNESEMQLLSELWWFHHTAVVCRQVKEIIRG